MWIGFTKLVLGIVSLLQKYIHMVDVGVNRVYKLLYLGVGGGVFKLL